MCEKCLDYFGGCVYIAYDSSDNQIGYVMSVTSKRGFGGNITLSLGVTNEGEIKGLEFLELNETQGFGSKAAEPEFKDQFLGKSEETYNLGDQVNAISGATITSKAVTSAINAGIYFINNIGGQ